VNFGAAIQNLLVSPTGTTNGSGFGAFVKTSTDSKGYDLKIDYIPLRNLRFNLGVAHNDVQIKEIDPFAAPANPDPIRLAAQQRFVAAGGSSTPLPRQTVHRHLEIHRHLLRPLRVQPAPSSRTPG
jgi:hypothetical protein